MKFVLTILLTVAIGVLCFPVVVNYIYDSLSHRYKKLQSYDRDSDRLC